MNSDVLLGWLLEGTLAVTAALLLVMALRLPLRRLFGAGAAYAVWALVPLSLLAVSLPAPVGQVVTRTLSPASVDVQFAQASSAPMLSSSWWALHGPVLLVALWAAGALLVACVFWHQQRRFIASLGRTRRDEAGLLRADVGASCPAVVGAWSPRIVLPDDFESRYPAHEAELVLAHERVHLARQDVRLNLLAVALRCVHWFNPLLHYATRAYRQDQELACDAAVLARHPHSRRAYADAMLKTQLAVLGLPVGCHWQSSQSLRERILMLKKPQPARGRMRLGAITIAALLLGASYTVWALQPERDQAPARLGTMFEDEVLYADVAMRSGPGELFVLDGAMGHGPSGASRAFSGKDGALRIGFGKSPEAPDTLLLTANVAGSKSAPELQWRLELADKRVDGGNARMTPGQSVTLAIDGAKHGAAASATVRIMRSSDGVLMGEFDEPQRFKRGDDGIYIDAHGGGVWGAQYKTAGEAQVLVQISKRGEVVATRVESSTPAGAFSDEDARAFFKGERYSPLVENGIAVPARIRTRITFSPPKPERTAISTKKTDTAQATSPAQTIEESRNLNPPKYPGVALQNKLGGMVVLIVDVAADGRPTAVKVDRSEPAGVFDAAVVEAAWKWKFKPEMKNGKPVAGRVRVPVEFSPHGDPAHAGATQG
ncbi:TonB family protein [Luteimonas cucumeris]|uniref:TonB family protein n=1 Tax=Luteimonas cucumeris TaxID=985012 RepID=A0A562LF56_9GAMM|nr:TonB family protein [Luteimonas cucumeris]TWI06235.1 TonB family protein [Luteimonas cucumeris]